MTLPKVRGIYKKNYNLAKLTWFKTGGNADIFFKPEDEEDLIDFLKQNKLNLPVNIIGAGSNIIIRDGGIEGVIIKLGRNFTEIKLLPNSTLLVGAGCLNFNLAKFAQNYLITGFEFLIGIPGTIGGGVAMNAGAYGHEFKDIIKAVHAVDGLGNRKIIKNEDMGFSYRKNSLPAGLIFTQVEFKTCMGNVEEITAKMQKISQNRSSTQPITEKTSGSTFANPEGAKAWELIDAAGMRGRQIGGALISEKHCNFMINAGGATSTDLEILGELVRSEVAKKFNIHLAWEIKRLGRNEQV